MVRTGTRHDVHLPAAGPSHFSGVASRLYLEFLYGIGDRTQVQRVERGIGVGDSIQQEVICVWPVAANTNRRALSRTPIQRIHIAGLRAMTHVCARHGQHQINEHAAVEWQFPYRSRLDHFAQAGVSCLEYLPGGHFK